MHAVQNNKIEAALRRLSYELSLENMYSPTDSELLEGGYVPQEDNIEVINSRQYISKNVPTEHERKLHLMYAMFMHRIKESTATPFSIKVFNVIKQLENEVCRYISSFKSPKDNPKLIT